MPKKDLLVPARYYMHLAQLLDRDGIDMREWLRETSLSMEALEKPDATLGFAQVDKLVCSAVQRSGRSDLGLDLGRLLTVSTHSIVGFGMLNSPNVDHALHFVARYFKLIMPSFRLRYVSGPDYGELHFTPTIAMSRQCLSFHLEAISMAALRDVRDLIGGPGPLCRLFISIPEPPHIRRYTQMRQLKCYFEAEREPGVRLQFATNLRAFSLSMADTNALKVAEERCNALVERVTSVRQFADLVAMTLREVGDNAPSLTELAATLNISKRTLTRYLEREGTSFRELSGRVHHELACERLVTGKMSITAIAYSLGFSDSANFTRAFRARAGCSPSEYRAQRSHRAS